MKYRLILLFSLCAFQFSNAQTIFKDGYIISLNGDTTYSSLKYTDRQSALSKITISKNGEEKKYTNSEILGFGYLDGRYFDGSVLENAFVEALIHGDLSLFRDKYTYYFKKKGDTTTYEVSNKREQIRENGKVYERDQTKWKGLVYFLISDCNAKDVQAESIRMSENYLIDLVSNYNTCKGSTFIEHTMEEPKSSVSFGLTAGVKYNTHSLYVPYGPKFDSDWGSGFFGGITTDLYIPKFSRNVHIMLELNYFSVSAKTEEYLYQGVFREIDELKIRGFQLPAFIQFRKEYEKMYIGLGGGVGFELYNTIEIDQTNQRNVDSIWQQNGDPADYSFDAVASGYAFLGGSVATKLSDGLTAGINVRYELQFGDRFTEDMILRINGLHIGAFCMF